MCVDTPGDAMSHGEGRDEAAGHRDDRRAEYSEPELAAHLAAPREFGAARSGRHREHLVPGRRRRVAPSFSPQEYATVVAAAARIGLTPTGYCAHAALSLATSPFSIMEQPHNADRSAAAAEALAALQAELADTRTAVVRVGTNLNQAVRAFNATGEAPLWLRQVVELCARALSAVDTAATRVHRRL
jgi:hypothetical protein